MKHPTDREIFLSHVAWPEEAQLLHDDYWGPRLRAHRARALLRRLAIGGALLVAIALIAAAATLIPAPTTAVFEEQPIAP